MSMVDVSRKPEVQREATAKGRIRLRKETIHLINQGGIEKGDPFTVAKVAGILAAKNTCSMIPLCHRLPLTSIHIDLKIIDDYVEVQATVKTVAQTGVEMEALVAVSAALLTLWDMTKQYEKDVQGQYPTTLIEGIQVLRKTKQKH